MCDFCIFLSNTGRFRKFQSLERQAWLPPAMHLRPRRPWRHLRGHRRSAPCSARLDEWWVLMIFWGVFGCFLFVCFSKKPEHLMFNLKMVWLFWFIGFWSWTSTDVRSYMFWFCRCRCQCRGPHGKQRPKNNSSTETQRFEIRLSFWFLNVVNNFSKVKSKKIQLITLAFESFEWWRSPLKIRWSQEPVPNMSASARRRKFQNSWYQLAGWTSVHLFRRLYCTQPSKTHCFFFSFLKNRPVFFRDVDLIGAENAQDHCAPGSSQ